MPIYSRGKNRYEVRIWWNGKPQGKIIHGTKKEAEAYEAKRRLELEAIAPSEYRTAPGFSQFSLGAYAIHAEARLGKRTWRNRRYQVATLVEFFGNKPLDRMTAADVERFQNVRAKQVKPGKVNDDVKVLKRILNYAVSQGVPARSPKVSALPVRKTKGRVMVWTEAEATKLYKAFQEHVPALLGMTVVMMNTGIRAGEALALEWSCVNFEKGMLLIYPNEEWQPKNGEPREVPFSSACLPWLQGKRKSRRWVFPSGKGTRYATWPQNQWNRAREKSGVGGSPHVCRHTFASHFLASQPDLFLLAKVLGHSHQRVTELYAHLLPDHLARAREVVCLPAPLALVSGHGPDTVSVGKSGKRSKVRQKRGKEIQCLGT